MNEASIQALVAKQRAFFLQGTTLDVDTRLLMLNKLRNAILQHENAIYDALKADLGKSPSESYMCEVGMTLSELTYMITHAQRLSREKTVWTPLAQFASRSYTKPSPYGVTLVMSPWNYPFMLSMEPLVDAIAAGNTVILKPSAYSPCVSAVLQTLIEQVFPEEYVAVITGGRQENQTLLRQTFDYIFFTGSQAVGKEVMRQAAEHLTPVTLELGGKSPCIVDRTANVELAARRIVFGKLLNCGQTCVAPDYILVEDRVHDRLLCALQEELTRQLGPDPLANADYGKLINDKHFQRVSHLIDPSKLVYGGQSDPGTLRIAPTLLDGVTWDDPVMQEEIFGPILPILTFSGIDQAVRTVNDHPSPLALYLFTSSKPTIHYVTARCQYGGGCINDTIIHLATTHLPFGGVGASGMGSYHGKSGFQTFTHTKSIVNKKTFLDLPFRYHPYQKSKDRLIRLFLH